MSKLQQKNGGKKKNEYTNLNTYLGRDARFFKDETVIGTRKNLSLKASAERIKLNTMDSLQPIKTSAENKAFTWSANAYSLEKNTFKRLMAGTKFELVFAPDGDDEGDIH